jgi:hypothetical protein
MKTAIVPAQITTVEDKITGNLSLSQLVLLIAPMFIGGVTYAIFPPSLTLSLYKLILVVISGVIFGLLAVRVKGQILFTWLVILLTYNIRPRYYIFDKNDSYLRGADQNPSRSQDASQEAPAKAPIRRVATPPLTLAEVMKLEDIIANPNASMRFKLGKKGGLSVVITQVK